MMKQPDMKDKAIQLQTILNNTIDTKTIFGTSFAIKSNHFEWAGSAGDLLPEQPYFIASTTKLFTSAIVFQLYSEGKLKLEDKMNAYLDHKITDALHIHKGKDYTFEINLTHLLAHTSGLPDYFQDKNTSGISLEKELIQGNDQQWTFEQTLERIKTLKPHFPPGTKNKAHYSDTNYQLLGKIIENITGKSFSDNCQARITSPLHLNNTYLYQNPEDSKPKPLYYHSKILHVPKAMRSFGPDGGMVSNSRDMLNFIEGYFTGKLFPKELIPHIQKWNPIFFPMKAGIGIHKFSLPWMLNPTGAVPDFIGHSGLSGALAFYCPKKNIFIAGTVNQVARPDLSFRMMIKLVRKLMQ